LGNINVNRAMVQPATASFLYSSCRWPGKDGFEFRTIANPFGTKTNWIVLGGSDPAGVGKAVDRLIELVTKHGKKGDLAVPRQLQVVVDGKDQSGAPAKASTGGPNGTYGLAGTITVYNRTGSAAQLKVVRKQLTDYLSADKPPAADDYGTESAVRGLDLVDTFVLSDEENTKMDNLLLKWVLDVVKKRPFWNPQGRSWSFGGHQACGSLSFYVITDYLLKNGSPNAAIPQSPLLKT